MKFAKLSNIHPIIGVCGAGADYARRAGCDAIVDYRRGKVVEDLRAALNGEKCYHAYDATSEKGSLEHLAEVLPEGAHHTVVLPGINLEKDIGKHLKGSSTLVGDCHNTEVGREIAFAYFR